ncbi:competence protein ComEC [Variibacter gotjawalensis]|uniref:ComEC/Rec2 family competence protein n=1 Tax=Variibacter gotjawalensis TaxID=1333996 RepID=UPI001D2F1133|nr:ComEC/Rec2 family competence protein [Variibacter gotjawalensis]NIK46116.1 competence protein ComEC [Variibacter gotjawalensis]
MGEGRRGRAIAWPDGVAGRPSRLREWSYAARLPRWALRVGDWAEAETGPGRAILWTPIAFGLGIAIYFTASHEPVVWAPASAFALAALFVWLLRARPVGFTLAILVAALLAGFLTATLRTLRAEHPVLARPLFGASLSGWIETREERERTDRIIIALASFEPGRGSDAKLERVRISVRKGTAPPPGSFVSLKARLSPPLAPLRPGGYDFARDLYFQKIGATGFALGKIERLEAKDAAPFRVRFLSGVAGLRAVIDTRIRSALPGDAGAIASALITGSRDAISAPVNDAMYVSSLAHVLSISGYHMAVVAGVVFFVVRALLALSATIALGFPIKKWAAGLALIAATGYLVLSGAEIATQRAYLMTAVVLLGIMVDRAALTLRTLAIAALAVLVIAPEAVVHPSFQMSFAATLALIASYERGMPWATAAADTSIGARIALWGGREIASLFLASVVAGAATTLFAAYHFNRLAPYGTFANLLAMPVVSVIVMPAGLLALIAAPFGLDDWLWRLMGQGIEWMMYVAQWVASWPGAVGRIAAFGVTPLLMGTAALVIVCLLRTPLRFVVSLPLAVIALTLAIRTPQPDVLIAANSEAVAVRGPDGQFSVMRLGSDTFAIKQWLAADGDARTPGEKDLSAGFDCDAVGCVAVLSDGRLVAVALHAEAFADDCKRAAIVVSRRTAPSGCAAKLYDRGRADSALALTINRDGFAETRARAADSDRPWAPSAVTKLQAPDATPAEPDLREDD